MYPHGTYTILANIWEHETKIEDNLPPKSPWLDSSWSSPVHILRTFPSTQPFFRKI
jgi:hypothetical protein